MDDQPVTKPTKAIVAFVVAGTGALAVAAADNAITLGEGIIAFAAACAAAGAVYGVTNKPVDTGNDGDEENQDDEVL